MLVLSVSFPNAFVYDGADSLFLVLGGTKVSGADIRDQNGILGLLCDACLQNLIQLSSCNSSHRECRQKLFRTFWTGQDDGG